MKNVKPLRANLLVKPKKPDTKLVLPDDHGFELFEVVEVGPGEPDHPVTVKPGDLVVVAQLYASNPTVRTGVRVGGEGMVLLPIDAIIAVAEEDDPEDVASQRVAETIAAGGPIQMPAPGSVPVADDMIPAGPGE